MSGGKDSTVAIVGAGPSGLGCAIELAAHRNVTLVDRLPVAGGSAGWERPEMRAATTQARGLGVELRLGQTAIRWTDRGLLVVGPGITHVVPAQQLFIAAGLRPATLANLGVTGDRPAGVLPATVAEHLLDAGVKLWDTVVIAGDGPWASHVASEAHALGSRVVALGGSATWADTNYERPSKWTVCGTDRVRAVCLTYESSTGGASKVVEVECDAVVLAGDPVPNRNVDGAVLANADGVTFVQPLAPLDPVGRLRAGHRAARDWLSAQVEVRLS